jgi:glucokinase
MLPVKEVVYVPLVPQNVNAILVGDIGGTNCNFGIFYMEKKEEKLLLSYHFKSKEITDFTGVIQQTLFICKNKYNITINTACLAAAGIISPERDYTKPTNLTFFIDTKDIIHRTAIKCVFLANDFEVIGHGLHRLNPQDIVQVKPGKDLKKTNQAIIGAGTGLGKCILLWESDRKHYSPVASEGGHADFPAQSELEYQLIQFIKKIYRKSCNVSWEDVLSGSGIQRIYQFFTARNHASQPNSFLGKKGLHPDEIFNSRHLDEHAFNTYELYAKFYARCAKNFALDALARGGIYIAGGIAAKNVELFRQPVFLDEFISCGKQEALLLDIPIFVIADYNVSLYGAVEYMKFEGLC